MDFLVFKISVGSPCEPGWVRLPSIPVLIQMLKKMRKNHFSKIFFLVLICFSLAACQGVQQSPTPTAGTSQLQSTATPAIPTPTATLTSTPTPPWPTIEAVDESDLAGLELTILHPWIDEAKTRFESLVGEFNNTNAWGINITPVGAGGLKDVSDQLVSNGMQTNLAIAQGYDLALLNPTVALANLGPYLYDADYGISTEYAPDSAFYQLSPFATYQEHWWHLPIAYQPGVLVYNQSWAGELGFDRAPRSPGELAAQMLPAAAEKLQDNDIDNNGTGGLWISNSPSAALSWYRAFYGQFDAGSPVLSFNNQAGNHSFTYLKQLYTEDASWVGQQKVPYIYFAERLALAYEGTLDDLLIQAGYQLRADSKDQWLTLPYPTPDGRGSISLETVSIGIANGTPAERLGSWLFARWLLTPEAQERLVRIHGYWPVTGDPQTIAPDYAREHPAWASALRDGVRLSIAPEDQKWAYGRLILQDAVRRVYALDEEYIPTVLEMLDSTLQELTGENLNEQ